MNVHHRAVSWLEGRWRSDLRRRWPGGLRDYQPWRGYRSGPLGTFTDDTQLTIVVARWLIGMGAGELDPAPLADAIEIWGETGRGIGHATHESLALLRLGRPWWESGVASAGNGAAMRAAPYGLRFAGQPDRLRYAAALGSVPTHADPTAVAAAIVQAAGVNHCLTTAPDALDPGALLDAALSSIADLDLPSLAHRGTGERRTLVERIREVGDMLGRPADDVVDHFFNGAFVLETTPVVLWLLLTYGDDPEEALVNAVMAGRDTDTVAAMLGNLVGALHGADAFPARWRGDHLEDHDGDCLFPLPRTRRTFGISGPMGAADGQRERAGLPRLARVHRGRVGVPDLSSSRRADGAAGAFL